jgi:putative ABC transport system substrate-binding protein
VRRRDFIALIGSASAWPLTARAQQPAVPIIGFISARSPEDSVNVLQEGLREGGGFADGENVRVEYRWARGNYGLLPALASEFVEHRVDVLVAVGGDASARAAKSQRPNYTSTSLNPLRRP